MDHLSHSCHHQHHRSCDRRFPASPSLDATAPVHSERLPRALPCLRSDCGAFLRWITTDTLGIAIATPAFVAILRTRWKLTDRWRTNSIYAVAVVAVTLGAFTQTRMPV